jgi:two-component system nitrate/nitrite response regulator NarL
LSIVASAEPIRLIVEAVKSSRALAAARPARPIRVLAADSQPLYRDAVVRVIRQQASLELVAEAADGRAALEAIERLQPDVAIVDATLPGLDGDRLLNAVVRERLPTRVVILAADPRSDRAFEAIAHGAGGYLSKHATADELEDAVRRAADGDTVIAPDVQGGLAREIRSRHHDDRPLLSDREREVLRLIADGVSGPAIGRRLHLAPATVKTHMQHLYGKLGVGDRAAAVATAMRRGLLE